MKIKKNMIIVVAVIMGVFILGLEGCNMLLDRIADRVIEKLEKDYSPSPYGPGINPDKVDVNVFFK
jgi:hypothetical protein